ncbi:MAG: tetratricopeptide repeat protein [Ignavibacteriae bacterium]|nr:MAG: tetratricopeptide repeat protein [Ignavibacteriota bacterium]
MKKIFLYFTVLSAIFSVSSYSQEMTPEQIFKAVENTVFFVRSYDENGYMIAQGSAVLTGNEGYVYTCFHVYEGSDKMEFELNGKKYTDAIIAGADPEKDIIIFKLKEIEPNGINIANSDSLIPGQVVYALGNPLGHKNTFSSGLVNYIRDFKNEDNNNKIQFSASISGGSSGGALLNSKGELIGIIASYMKKGQNINFAVPVNEFLHTELININDSARVRVISDICKGYSLYKNDSYFNANDLFNSSLECFPDDVKALKFSGKNYSNAGQYDSAIARYTKLISLKPDDKKIYSERGWIYYYKGNDTLAINDFNESFKIDSTYIYAIMGRANTYQFVTKNYDLAIRDYNRLISIDPDFRAFLEYRGECYLAIGDTQKAVSDMLASIDYDYDDDASCYYRGSILLDLGEYECALSNFTQAIKLEPGIYNYYYSRGVAYTKRRDYFNAINDYLSGLRINPQSEGMLNNLGYCYLHLDEYDEAEKYFNRALYFDSNHFDALLGLSILSFKQNKKTACKKYIHKAVKLEPKLNKGMKGLEILEKSGYFWSDDDRNFFNEIFKLAGYYSYDDEKIHLHKGKRTPETK